MPLHLAHLGSSPAITSPHAGLVITLTPDVCFDGCNNISEILERLQHIRTNAKTSHQDSGSALVFLIGSTVSFCTSREFLVMCFSCSQVFLSGLLLSQQMMERLSSSACTVPSIDDYFEHNMWNPLLELLFFDQANGIVASLVEIDVAKIALSCHFALDLLWYKEAALDST